MKMEFSPGQLGIHKNIFIIRDSVNKNGLFKKRGN
jgi:hypothetical protein